MVPRELASRSRWDVPYHNGIRSDLPGPVPPGARVSVSGRILPPRWPGLYWLQWDLVEEQVAWFAQVSPRQSRRLVLVLPPIDWVAAPLPFLVALAGLIALWRGRWPAVASIADAIWCSTALAAKPLILVHAALLEPTAAAYWLIAVCALVPSLLCLAILPRPIRAWVLLVVGAFGSLLVLADVVYYRFFGDVLSAPAILAAGQTGHVWGSIRSLLSPILIWTIVDLPLASLLAMRLTHLTRPRPPLTHRLGWTAATLAAVAIVGLMVSAPRTLRAMPIDQMFRDRAVVEQLGVFGFHGYDVWNYARSTWLRTPASDAQLREALGWFEERAPMRAAAGAAAFGAARGRNLIVVQVESLQDYVVDYRVADQDVMPHLRRWPEESVRFTNVTDETSEGRTSDAEFTTMTSLLPLEHGAVAFRFPGNHYAALPRVLSERGYATMSAVAFEPGFWNRQVMHPSYGFQRTLFEPDFQLTEQIGWGLNDRDFLQQMIPRLEGLAQPFAAWLITLSLHHPFDDFPATHKVLRLGELEGTSFGNYLHTMHFFDEALERFKQALERDGLLDRSVLVVFGDHDAGFVRDSRLAKTIGIGDGDAAWTLNDRVPLFIRAPAPPPAMARDALRGLRGLPAGQTDLAPTVLCLLGIDAARLPYVGRNLFGPAATGPVPRPYGEWIDESHLLVTGGGSPLCRDAAGRAVDAAACADGDRIARRERAVSRLVIAADLQERLRVLMNR